MPEKRSGRSNTIERLHKRDKAGRQATLALKKPAEARTRKERRVSRRFDSPNLVITEHRGDYLFFSQAKNISLGGIFLAGRVKSGTDLSVLRIPIGNGARLDLKARPMHDRILPDSCGTGYRFETLTGEQSRILKGFLRDLD